jgi:hypothetical protein
VKRSQTEQAYLATLNGSSVEVATRLQQTSLHVPPRPGEPLARYPKQHPMVSRHLHTALAQPIRHKRRLDHLAALCCQNPHRVEEPRGQLAQPPIRCMLSGTKSYTPPSALPRHFATLSASRFAAAALNTLAACMASVLLAWCTTDQSVTKGTSGIACFFIAASTSPIASFAVPPCSLTLRPPSSAPAEAHEGKAQRHLAHQRSGRHGTRTC